MPKISVIMSTRDTPAKFLRESIESILAQTFKDFEFIIVDDGSDANDVDVIREFTDNRIRILKNECNKGLPYSLNRAINESSGQYIARMDSDDYSLPNRLEKQYWMMETHQDIDVLGIVAETFGKSNRIITSPIYKDVNDQLFFRSSIVHPGVMIRRSFLESNKLLYDEQFLCSQDFEFWTRISERGKIAILPEILLLYRVHENQISSQKAKIQKEYGYAIYTQQFRKINIELSLEEYEAHYALVNDKVAPSYPQLKSWCKKLVDSAKNNNQIHCTSFFIRQIRYYLLRNTFGHLVFRNYTLSLMMLGTLLKPNNMLAFIYELVKRFCKKWVIIFVSMRNNPNKYINMLCK